MAGYYPLGSYDAHRLAQMIGQMSNGRNRVARADMTLWCWSRMLRNGRPCPHFTAGIRTIRDACGVSTMAARCFLERAEELGWLVRLGETRNKQGRYTKRTFSWVAEEAAEDAGMGLEEWLESVGGYVVKTTDGCVVSATDPVSKAQQKTTDGCVVSAGGNNTQQRAELSEKSALRSSPHGEREPLSDADLEELYGIDLAPDWMRGDDG